MLRRLRRQSSISLPRSARMENSAPATIATISSAPKRRTVALIPDTAGGRAFGRSIRNSIRCGRDAAGRNKPESARW